MAIRVLVETIDVCEVCGEVACESDLWCLDPDEAEDVGLARGEAVVCSDCYVIRDAGAQS